MRKFNTFKLYGLCNKYLKIKEVIYKLNGQIETNF